MAVEYRCPGVDSYGHGLSETFIHMAGCCAQFLLMSPEQQAKVGLKYPAPRQEPMPAPAGYQVDTISMRECEKLIEKLQYRAAERPDEEPEPVIAWVLLDEGDTEQQVQALYDLGRPYGLVLGYSAPVRR